MSATPTRFGGFQTRKQSLRRSRSADVARRFEGLAAPPSGAGDLLAKATVTSRYGRAANLWIPAGLLAVAGLAAAAMMAGCSARKPESTSSGKDQSSDRDCSQSALCLSSLAQTTGGSSTEGGGLGTDDRASGFACGQLMGGGTSAVGTAGTAERSGTGRAARDRRGLADAWPEVRPSSCTSPVPVSPVVLGAGAG
jgi:hypothetical protein